MDIINFSAADLEILRGIVYRERNRPKNTTGRSAVPAYEDNPPPTTEVYIAKVPDSGIPALVRELFSSDGDKPGYRTCDIYRIRIVDGVPRLQSVSDPSTTMSRRVYNISLSEIVEEDIPWVKIVREKFGSWLADTGSTAAAVGTGSDSDYCGHLILNCPEDGPGTGSEVVVYPPIGSPPISSGYASVCNDGEIVLSTIYLTVTYGHDAVSVPITTTDGHSWKYTGPALDVGACGSMLQVQEVDLRCDPPWRLTLVLNLPTLQAFGNPADFPNFSIVTSDPLYWTTRSYGAVTTGCGSQFLDLSLSE